MLCVDEDYAREGEVDGREEPRGSGVDGGEVPIEYVCQYSSSQKWRTGLLT